MSAPILFMFFNRKDVTPRVFEEIRRQRPTDLFLASDGPRSTRSGEAEVVEGVRREILGMIDWECNVRTLFREANLGCKKAVSGAIDWFFQNVEEGIILEDDCLPDPTFFGFCEEMLDKYRHDPKVFCVSGDASSGFASQDGASYWFSPYPLIWGWATWRRAWNQYSVDIAEDFRTNGSRVLGERFGKSSFEYHYWADILDRSSQGRIDTWDYQWAWCVFKAGGLSCVSNANLISNLGFSANATHTSDDDVRAEYPLKALGFPLKHPSQVESHHPGAQAIRDRIFAPGIRSVVMRYGRKLKRWAGR